MKLRTDFVTNSSSSSFICVAKIDKSEKLIEYLKEEYGKYGLNLLDTLTVSGKHIKEEKWDYDEFKEYCKDNRIEIKDDDTYLQASFIEWSNDGNTNGDDAWLYEHIPEVFKDNVYEGGEC